MAGRISSLSAGAVSPRPHAIVEDLRFRAGNAGDRRFTLARLRITAESVRTFGSGVRHRARPAGGSAAGRRRWVGTWRHTARQKNQ